MPSLNYKNAGSLIDYEYTQGSIVELYPDNDTCDLSGICGELKSVPIFYHCAPNSVLRNNGALEGSAAGFTIGDIVVVLKAIVDSAEVIKGVGSSNTGSKYYVVGHYEGLKKCQSSVLVFYLYTGVNWADFNHQLLKEDWYGINEDKTKCPYVSRVFAWDMATNDYANDYTFIDEEGKRRLATKDDWPVLYSSAYGDYINSRLGRYKSNTQILFVFEDMNMFVTQASLGGMYLKPGDYVWPTKCPFMASRILFISGGIIITDTLCITESMIGNDTITISSWCPLFIKETYNTNETRYSLGVDTTPYAHLPGGPRITSDVVCEVTHPDTGVVYHRDFESSSRSTNGDVKGDQANLFDQNASKDIIIGNIDGTESSITFCDGTFIVAIPVGSVYPKVPEYAIPVVISLVNRGTFQKPNMYYVDCFIIEGREYSLEYKITLDISSTVHCTQGGTSVKSMSYIREFVANEFSRTGEVLGFKDTYHWSVENPLGVANFYLEHTVTEENGSEYVGDEFTAHSVNFYQGGDPLLWDSVLDGFILNAGCTTVYNWQYYVYPGYDINVFAQCENRVNSKSVPTTNRNTKLEDAIKNLIDTCKPNLVSRFGEGQPVYAQLMDAGIYGQYFSEKRTSSEPADIIELIRQIRNYHERNVIGGNNEGDIEYDFALYEDGDLMQATSLKANAMAASFTLSHDIMPSGEGIGECLALAVYGLNTHKIVAGWMKSPGHAAIIMNTQYNIAGYAIKTVNITKAMLPIDLAYGTGMYDSDTNTYTSSNTSTKILYPMSVSFIVLQMGYDGRYTA